MNIVRKLILPQAQNFGYCAFGALKCGLSTSFWMVKIVLQLWLNYTQYWLALCFRTLGIYKFIEYASGGSSVGFSKELKDVLIHTNHGLCNAVCKKQQCLSGPNAHTQKRTSNSDPLQGIAKGVDGHLNSCYMDALLFTMFYTTNSFDMLYKPKATDSQFAITTKQILKSSIALPLRKAYYCSSESVMRLRKQLQFINPGVMGSFMDPRDFINILCRDALSEGVFIDYERNANAGWGDFVHLMYPDNPKGLPYISVQQIIMDSFRICGDLILSRLPSPVLILGNPRSNRELVSYKAIIPNAILNIGKLVKSEKCVTCGKKANWEQQHLIESRVVTVEPLCKQCVNTQPTDSIRIVNRNKLRLRSVICIHGAHFVAYTCKCEVGSFDAKAYKWYYFDSMVGNTCEVEEVPLIEQCLRELSKDNRYNESNIPPRVKDLLSNGHINIYEPICFVNN